MEKGQAYSNSVAAMPSLHGAIPMMLLFFVAEIIARLVDRARGKGENSTNNWDDDEVSAL